MWWLGGDSRWVGRLRGSHGTGRGAVKLSYGLRRLACVVVCGVWSRTSTDRIHGWAFGLVCVCVCICVCVFVYVGVGVCGVFVGVGVYRWCFESAPEFVGLCVVCTIIDFYDSN